MNREKLMSIPQAGRWCELPEDPLEHILKRSIMELTDILACRDVCRSWRSMIANLYQPLQPLLPAVLFVPGKKKKQGGKANFVRNYSTNTPQVYRLCVPYNDNYYGHKCINSSRGWLLVTHINNEQKKFSADIEIRLFNPLSKVEVQLPRCRQPFTFTMSSSPSEAGCTILAYSESNYVFWRPGNKEWSLVREAKERYKDMVYYNGQFYAVDEFGFLKRFNLAEDYPFGEKISVQTEKHKEPLCCYSRYLVVLPSTGTGSNSDELLMVTRCSYCEPYKNGCGCNESFKVFKADWYNSFSIGWREVTSFGNGDLALFLAHNDSFFVSARDPADCRRNSIYFVDDRYESYLYSDATYYPNMGAFDLETGRMVPFYNRSSFNRWFLPSI